MLSIGDRGAEDKRKKAYWLVRNR